MIFTFETIEGFDVMHTSGLYTFESACALPQQFQGAHSINDWVLPDRLTLLALATLSEGIGGRHWSSSKHTIYGDFSWCVSFHNKHTFDQNHFAMYQVRLVRASQCFDICIEAAKRSMSEAGITPTTQGENT